MTDVAAAPYTVLVNSSDGFEDCWAPFFTLLGRYWPGLRAPVLLNTERTQWTPPPGVLLAGLPPVRSTQVQPPDAARLTWGACLFRALDQVRTPLVLYMQEDYFVEAPVRDDVVARAAALMEQHPEVGHVALTHIGPAGPYAPWEPGGGEFGRVARTARYRVSTQAGLWRTDVLRSYVRPDENGWMFEIFATWRSRRRDDLFLALQPGAGRAPAFQYVHTGIIKGRWHPAIPALFAREGFHVDFARRGFYVQEPALVRRFVTTRKLVANPRALLRALQ